LFENRLKPGAEQRMVVDDENFHDSFPGINICQEGIAAPQLRVKRF
jgi:hypothetical protein